MRGVISLINQLNEWLMPCSNTSFNIASSFGFSGIIPGHFNHAVVINTEFNHPHILERLNMDVNVDWLLSDAAVKSSWFFFCLFAGVNAFSNTKRRWLQSVGYVWPITHGRYYLPNHQVSRTRSNFTSRYSCQYKSCVTFVDNRKSLKGCLFIPFIPWKRSCASYVVQRTYGRTSKMLIVLGSVTQSWRQEEKDAHWAEWPFSYGGNRWTILSSKHKTAES